MSIETAVAFRRSCTSQLRILVLLVLRDREASFSRFSPNFPPTPRRHSVKKSLDAFDRRPSSVRQQLTRKLTCIRGRSRSHRHCRGARACASACVRPSVRVRLLLFLSGVWQVAPHVSKLFDIKPFGRKEFNGYDLKLTVSVSRYGVADCCNKVDREPIWKIQMMAHFSWVCSKNEAFFEQFRNFWQFPVIWISPFFLSRRVTRPRSHEAPKFGREKTKSSRRRRTGYQLA